MNIRILAFFLCFAFCATAAAADDRVRLMATRDDTPIWRSVHIGGGIVGKIAAGAVVKGRLVGKSPRCPEGWFERENGGVLCARHLVPTTETSARPAPDDAENVRSGAIAFEVMQRGPALWENSEAVGRKPPKLVLRKGSVLSGVEQIEIAGRPVLRTREGVFVESTPALRRLPEAIGPIGWDASKGQGTTAGIAIAPETALFDSSSADAKVITRLVQYAALPAPLADVIGPVELGWVALADGTFVRDADVARLRTSPRPKRLSSGERWLAVDLDEQLLHAYEGEQLVRLVPCSTGIRDNTTIGSYRIELKRRRQTMQLVFGQIRVEDVQWVMYFDRQEALAIHSAYWHADFGRPRSHGCVNVTPGDARWLFEWTGPTLAAEDSERTPSSSDPGTQVVVFRKKEPR